MSSGRKLTYNNNGFTLVELLVVLFLLAFVYTIAIPKPVDNILVNSIDTKLSSELLTLSYTAKNEDQIKTIRFILGSENYYVDNNENSFEESLVSLRKNGNSIYGIEGYINAYPNGVCDYFELTLSSGLKIVSDPINCTVSMSKAI